MITSAVFPTAKDTGKLGNGKKIIEKIPWVGEWCLYDYRTAFRPQLIIIHSHFGQVRCPKNWVVG